MKILMFALSAALTLGAADFAAAKPLTRSRTHAAPPAVVTLPPRPDRRGGWGGPEWYTKGWGGWGWGYGRGQGLLAGALVGEGLTAPYRDFTFGYPKDRRYPYVAFPYGSGFPYYNVSYGYYRPPNDTAPVVVPQSP